MDVCSVKCKGALLPLGGTLYLTHGSTKTDHLPPQGQQPTMLSAKVIMEWLKKEIKNILLIHHNTMN